MVWVYQYLFHSFSSIKSFGITKGCSLKADNLFFFQMVETD